MPLDALKNGLGIGQLGQLHDVPDDPARQLHAGVLILGLVRKAAHGLRLDGIVQVHQHVQPLGALEALTARHTGLLCGLLPQRLGSIGHAAHGAVIVHKALILLRRVAVPHAFGLPQGHAVAPCLGHRLAPAAVPLHKLGLRLPALVHGVLQLVQLRVLVPQFAVAVGRPVLDLPCQRLGQRFGLVHVRAVRLQVVHQHFGLLRQLCPVRLAAVGLQPAPGQLVHRAPAHVHALCQPKKLAQCVQRRRLLRDHPAGLLLLVPLRVPARLLRDLETHIRHTVQHRGTLGIVSGLVQLHLHALLLQLVDQALACVVRQNRRPHFVKAHRALGLCFKIPRRDGRHIVVQLQDHLGRILADNVTFLGKNLSNGCCRAFTFGSSQQNFSQYLPLSVAAIAMCRSLLPQFLNDGLNLAVRIFQQLFVFCLRHLLQSAFIRSHFIQTLVLRCGRAHQRVGRKAPRTFSSCFFLVHCIHQILQRVGVMQLGKAAPVAVPGINFLAVVDSFLSQYAFHLRQDPLFHLRIRCLFLNFFQHGVGVSHELSALILSHHVVIGTVQQHQQFGLDHALGFLLRFFFTPPELFHGPGFFRLPHLVQYGMGKFMVAVGPVSLNDISQGLFAAHRFNGLFASTHLRCRKTFLLLHGNVYSLPDVSQICCFHAGILGQFLRQLFRALVRCLHIHNAGNRITSRKFAARRFSAQFCQFCVQSSCFLGVHLILHAGSCRRPCIRTVHPVFPVHHGVNGITAKHQRDRPILRVPLLCLYHRDRRRRHPAQFQRFLQVLFG